MKDSKCVGTLYVDLALNFKITFWQAIKLRILGKHVREYIENTIKSQIEEKVKPNE